MELNLEDLCRVLNVDFAKTICTDCQKRAHGLYVEQTKWNDTQKTEYSFYVTCSAHAPIYESDSYTGDNSFVSNIVASYIFPDENSDEET